MSCDAIGSSLVEVDASAGSFGTLGLSLGELANVAVHGVVDDGNLGSHCEELREPKWDLKLNGSMER